MFPLNHHYGPRLRALHWCTEQLITNALAQMDLTASQGRIIGFIALSPKPLCARDLEEFFHLSHPSVSGTLSRLERKGFIEFRPDAADRRCKHIHILPKGLECHAAIAQTIADIERRMVEGFTPAEQAQFSDLLDRAIENMGGGLCCHTPKEEHNQ